MEKSKAERKSNIELLRLLAAIAVIVLHYNNPTIGRALAVSQGISNIFLFLLESLLSCAVNVFVLISGYFLIKTQERDFLKPIILVFQVIFFQEAFYLLPILFKKYAFSPETFFRKLVPGNWYVILYIGLYLISPYINIVLNYLKVKGGMRFFLGLIVVIYGGYPMLIDALQSISGATLVGLSTVGAFGNQYGYTIVNFIIMYSLGAYLQGEKNKQCVSISVVVLLFTVLIIFFWSYTEYRMKGTLTALEYCNPLLISEAVLIFIFFQKMHIQNRFVNRLAGASFTVYLVHGFLIPYCRIDYYATKGLLTIMLHLAVCVTVIYFFGLILDWIFRKITNPLWEIIRRRWKRYRIYQV